mmetsp:Transcript_101166/g.198518  ORF Transcript_101166/g.198518 Transcript_101166/m.198518 type:complete len:331 (+) Transcript_101166:319-1311(+)
MEDVLVGVVFDSHDRLDSEYLAFVWRQLTQHAHPLRQFAPNNFTFLDEGEGIHFRIVPVTEHMPMPMVAFVRRPLTGRRTTAMTTAFAIPSAIAMAAAVAVAAARGDVLNILRIFLDILVREPAHVVRADVAQQEEILHANLTSNRAQHLRIPVDFPDAVFDNDRLFWCHQIQFVKNHPVGESDLLVSFIDLALINRVIQARKQVLRICQGDDCVEAQVRGDFRVGHEGADNRHRVSHASSFDHDLIDLATIPHVVDDTHETTHEIAANGATHATIIHENHLFSQGQLVFLHFQQRIVDGDLAKLIFDDRDFLLPLHLEHVIQQCCFAGA